MRGMARQGWSGLVLAAVALSATLMGGCQNQKVKDYDRLVTENEELRGQVDSMNAQLASETAACSQIQADNLEMARALEDMRSQLQGRTSGMQTSTLTLPADNMTGFSGDFGGATVTQRGSDVVVEVAGDVLFDSGSATLKSTSRQTLDRIAQTINARYSNNLVRVEGHTDSDPIRKSKWESNEALSYARAAAVQQHLISRGVPTSRLQVAAFGSSRPKSTKQASRRVEIVVLDAFQ